MADTRCVNPEYQLDVDVLILEYLLYNAISAQFMVLRPRDEDNVEHRAGKSPSSDGQAERDRLLKAFDSFIQIFRSNHANYVFAPATSFNMTILEIIVLLDMSKFSEREALSVKRSSTSKLPTNKTIGQQCLDEQQGFLNDRRQWLAYCEMLERPNTELPLKEQHILDQIGISSWTSFRDHHIVPGQLNRIKPLFSVLHRFMSLSSEIAPIMGNINSLWMDLALQLMLQTTLQILSSDEQQPETSENGAVAKDGQKQAMPGLIECFAFGYLPNIATSVSISDAEHAINTMFSAAVEEGEWSRRRLDTLSEFRLPQSPSSPSTDPKPYVQQIARLKHKHPYQEFEANLLKCLDNFWELNCEKVVGAKPVLVQIEEGGLDGMNEAEFEEFMIRVGLKSDDRGLFKLKI